MTLLQQIKVMTGLGFTLEIREAMHGGLDVVVRNKHGRHRWCSASAQLIEANDEAALVRALQECEPEWNLAKG
jgi:hypothetical protein